MPILLTTKLNIPRVRPALVPRTRLTQRLTEGLRRKLTLVSAPAGFGKTTLLSAWAHAQAQSAAWLSLDEGDNDPARFVAYLVAALRSQPVLADALDALEEPSTSALQSSRLETAITALVNALNAQPTPCMLVLDDYHVIHAPEIHEALAFLLAHQPPTLHLVIATRSDPPLPLARLRVRDQLTELRAADLRFTHAEAAEFLNRVMGLTLSSEDVNVLAKRTEGWIAGLQMAALALQETTGARHEDATTFVRAFAGSHRYVLDYLMAEVLRRQPPDTRAFLLHTSILTQLSGPLCDAVAGTEGAAQSMLEQLEATNLFVVPLDDRRQWYRYHRLFADFLRAQLKQEAPELIPDLHQRAAAWLEAHDFPHEAVTHALHGEDFERAARLILQLAESLLMHGEVATLLHWLEALPVALVEARPRLIVYYAGAFTIAGRLEEAETYLQKAETALTLADAGTQTYHEIQGLIAATRAYHRMLKGDLTGAMTLARQAEDNITATSFLTPVVGWLTGFAYYFERDADAARRAFDETTALSQKLGNTLMATLSLYTYGYLQTIRGRLREAEAVFAQGLQLTNSDGALPPSLTLIHQGLGDIARERNRLDEAARHLDQAVALAEAWGNAEVLADSYMVQARIMLERDEIAVAAELHARLVRLAAEETLAELTQRQMGARRAQFWIATGDLARAEAWATSLAPLDEAESEIESLVLFVRGMEAATVARLRLAQGRPDDALAQVTPLQAVAMDVAWSGVALELCILRALAHAALENTAAALNQLRKALTLAAPEGYVRLFLDEGEPMQRLLAQVSREIRDPALASYVQTLLKAFPTALLEQDDAIYEKHDLEPLSERELEVLQLIVAGYTNREIAERLYIAVSTVKSHINNLYGKLNVSNRAQAVTRAHALGLVESA